MNINLNSLRCICAYVLASFTTTALCLAQILYNDDFVTWTKEFSSTIICMFLFQLYVFKSLKIKFFSVFSLISFFSYLFQFGATISYSLGFDRYLWNNRIKYYASYDAYIKGSVIALVCIQWFTFGGLFFNAINSDNDTKYNESYVTLNTSIEYYKFLGYSILFISLPFFVYTYFYNLAVIISGGAYTALLEHRLPGYITSLGKFFYIGLMILTFYYYLIGKKLPYLATKSLIFLLLVVFMLLGSRSEPMVIFFAYFIFYFHCIEGTKTYKNKKNLLLIFLFLYLLVNLLYSIQITRKSEFDIHVVFEKFFSNGFEVFLHEFSEFGGSILSTATIVDRVDTFHPSWFFIKEVLSLSPIAINSKYSVVASTSVGAFELGSTFVGEMYYYFGMYSPIATFFMAAYIVNIEKHVHKILKKGNYVTFFMCIMWMWQEINCIRASYNLAIKTFIYSFLLFKSIKLVYNSFHDQVK